MNGKSYWMDMAMLKFAQPQITEVMTHAKAKTDLG